MRQAVRAKAADVRNKLVIFTGLSDAVRDVGALQLYSARKVSEKTHTAD